MGAGVEFFARLNGRAGVPAFLDALKWDEHGLVTVVSQDVTNDQVLGVAFANRVALEASLKSGLMHYYSRSRQKLWKKGEDSGHVQKLIELRVDCDGDALLARVRQVEAFCHLGFRSCFSYRLMRNKNGRMSVKQSGKRLFDPEKVYIKR
jgi:phosphoribosyl-AMP cyclohydrolase